MASSSFLFNKSGSEERKHCLNCIILVLQSCKIYDLTQSLLMPEKVPAVLAVAIPKCDPRCPIPLPPFWLPIFDQ
jgi:hypothetical protein